MFGNKFYLSQCLGKTLKDRGQKLCVAESCTGGYLSEELTNVVGSSEWFERGYVTYSNAAKIELLGVSDKTLQTYGAVSAETAREMATGALKHNNSDICISITGIAGPISDESKKPVGLVWFAIAQRNGSCEVREMHFYSGRKHIRECAVEYALNWLLEVVG